MANVDRPRGFRPVMSASGDFTGRVRKVYSTADNLFIGDLVKQAADPVLSGDGIYQEVDRCSAVGDLIAGVVVGFEPNPTALGNLYHTASSTYGVFIIEPEGVTFEVQGDAAMDRTDVGLNADATFTAGSTTTGASNMELSASSAAATAGLQLRIIGMVDRADGDNSDAATNVKCLVRINQSANADQTAGV
jgi:hypothetical protein